MDVKSRAGLPGGDFGSEGHIESFLISKIANDPLGNNQLVGCLTHGNGQEFDFSLFIDQIVLHKIAYFGVAIFDLTSSTGNVVHALHTEIIGFGEGCRFVIRTLVYCRIAFFVGLNDVVFQFSHCFEIHACGLFESACCFDERLFGRRRKGLSVFVEIGTEQAECWDFCKGINKGGGETWYDIEVATTGFDETKKAGAVYTLSTGEHSVEIVIVSDDEIERFEASISCGVEEIEHSNAVFGNKT